MRIGIDLGGTKIEAAALGDDGVVRGRRRVPTPKRYGELLGAVAGLVEAIEREQGPARGVGVAAPGSLAPGSDRVRNAQNTPLDGQPFVADLGAALRGRRIELGNDAQCFALSEARDGAGAGHVVVFGAILGTGVGGGLVVRGGLVAGRHGIAGEWGHGPLPGAAGDELPGPACTCGRRGCVEAWLSGPGLAADHARVAGEAGGALTAVEIAARAGEGDAACAASVERYCARLARALAPLVHVLDPDAIVIGGGLSHLAAIYARVPAALSEHTLCPVTTKVLRNKHGDASGLRGAAWLVS